MDPYPVAIHLRTEPLGQDLGGLDQEELTITVKHANPEVGKGLGHLAEEIDDEPFVLDIVTIVCCPVEIC